VEVSPAARNATATLASVSDNPTERPWSLVVAHHPQPEHFGQRCALPNHVSLGRNENQLGAGLLLDQNVSRRHAELAIDGDQLIVTDLGSHNGTFVNGNRIQQSALASGDVLEIGRLLFVVDRARPTTERAPSELPGISEPYLRVISLLRRPATRGAPVVLWGETGTGKARLAQFVHDHRGSRGNVTVMRASTLPKRFDEITAMLERLGEGTVLIKNLDEADLETQRWLVECLDRAGSNRQQIIASFQEDPDALVQLGRLRGELMHRFGGWRFRVPPLRERRVDIPVLAQAFARRFSAAHVTIDQGLMRRLILHDWPGNVRELEAIIERVAAQCEGRSTLESFPELGELLSAPSVSVASAPAHRVHRDGQWYCGPEGELFRLGSRKTLARVLAVLVESYEQNRGTPLSIGTLLSKAWPNERINQRSGANRVYVALTTLRKLGLRDLLVRNGDGYMLDPDVRLQIEDAP